MKQLRLYTHSDTKSQTAWYLPELQSQLLRPHTVERRTQRGAILKDKKPNFFTLIFVVENGSCRHSQVLWATVCCVRLGTMKPTRFLRCSKWGRTCAPKTFRGMWSLLHVFGVIVTETISSKASSADRLSAISVVCDSQFLNDEERRLMGLRRTVGDSNRHSCH